MKQSLLSLRKEIDCVDSNILDLLAKRMKISGKVAKFKKKQGIPINQPKREREVLKQLKKQAKNKKINGKLIESIYTNIMKQSKEIQKKCQ